MGKRLSLFLPFLFLGTAPAHGQAPALVNPSFEKGGYPPAGWREITGARSGSGRKTASVTLDSTRARSGKYALRFQGDASTTVWPALVQEVPVKPGDRVILRVAAASGNIRREGRQFANADAFLFFLSQEGLILKRTTTEILTGTRPWVDLFAHALAPPGTVKVRVGLILTMSGTLWFDDLRLTIAHTSPFDEAARAAAFSALQTRIERTWPFFGFPGKPAGPEEVFGPFRKKALAAPTPAAFVMVCRKALARLHDLHTWIMTPRGPMGTVPMATYPRNWNLQAIRSSLEKVIYGDRQLLVGRMKAGPGYALIATFRLKSGRLDKLLAALDRLAGAPSLILDVRANGGGNEGAAMAVARRFAAKRVLYAMHRFRDPTLGGLRGFGPVRKRYLDPLPGRKPDLRPVAVLQGPYCVSSTEAFLLMAKALPNLVNIGLPSRGASGNPALFDLLPGYQVWSSRWQSLDPKGKCVEGIGVQPDILVKVPPKAYAEADPTLEKALEYLSKQKQGAAKTGRVIPGSSRRPGPGGRRLAPCP